MGKTHDDQIVREALDLAIYHFADRRERAFDLIRAQAELLGIDLPEGFGTVGETKPVAPHKCVAGHNNHAMRVATRMKSK